MLKIVQFYYGVLGLLSPTIAAKSALNLFQKVRKKDIRDREKPFYEKARSFKFDFKHEKLDGYMFGEPAKEVVFLIHGWDSNAGCLLAITDELLKKGKYVVSFNLPAHAFHTSPKTNLFESKNAFKSLLNQLPEFESISVISHSFGSALTAYALSELDLEVNQLVFLTSPNQIIDIFYDFKQLIKLNDKAFNRLVEYTDEIIEEPLRELSVTEKLTNVKFKHLHLIHDEADKIIPFKTAQQINQGHANSTLHAFQNIGHYRMLWNEAVINKTISCLDG